MPPGAPFPYAHVWDSLLLWRAPVPAADREKIGGALDELRTAMTRRLNRRGSALVQSATLDAAAEAEPPAEVEPDELGWLRSEWSALALRRQLEYVRGADAAVDISDGEVAATGNVVELSKALWAAMKAKGLSFAEVRKLDVRGGGGGGGGAPPTKAEQAICWVECMTGLPLAGQSVHSAFQSGEVLCDVVNRLQPGLITRVTRAAQSESMLAMRLAAKQRDNITRYLAHARPCPCPPCRPSPITHAYMPMLCAPCHHVAYAHMPICPMPRAPCPVPM